MATQAVATPTKKDEKVEAPEPQQHQQQPRGIPTADVLNKIQSAPADRYQIRRDIVLGGAGACKVAFDQLAEREVVLKTSGPQGGWPAERIIKEARYAARLNHPNVVRLLELGSFGKDQVFMTMPFIEGSSLDVVIKKISDAGIPGLTGYSVTAAAELFDKICAGVEHAHAHGLLHLDLKPQNVVVGSRGEVVVVDWGVGQNIGAPEFPKRYASAEGSGNTAPRSTRPWSARFRATTTSAPSALRRTWPPNSGPAIRARSRNAATSTASAACSSIC
jgi:serine/threonine protein kinase